METMRLKSFAGSKKQSDDHPQVTQTTHKMKSYCIMRSSKLREAKMISKFDDDDNQMSPSSPSSSSCQVPTSRKEKVKELVHHQNEDQENLQSKFHSMESFCFVSNEQPNNTNDSTTTDARNKSINQSGRAEANLSDSINTTITCQLAKRKQIKPQQRNQGPLIRTRRHHRSCCFVKSTSNKLAQRFTALVLVILCLWLQLIDINLISDTNKLAFFSGPIKPVHGQQYKPIWPDNSVQQEIFLLNLEDGYFGCQVNQSQEFLQLFELSRLCDGKPQCYLGTDEIEQSLKCKNRAHCGSFTNQRGQQESISCVNGVCLDGLCYCNDGFGGKSCDIPDENECKFRPCDVFAHCTNTMGSYYCSCYPGYDGDGIHCQVSSLNGNRLNKSPAE